MRFAYYLTDFNKYCNISLKFNKIDLSYSEEKDLKKNM